MRNLLDALQSVPSAHGVERLIASEEDDVYTTSECQTLQNSNGHEEGGPVIPTDCKEAPQYTPCTKSKGPASHGDSLGWYTSCAIAGCHRHGATSDDYHRSPLMLQPKKMASVLPGTLGLSSTCNNGTTIQGEVTQQFIHAITSDDMLLIDFEGVLGVRSVSKKLCFDVGVHDGGSRQLVPIEATQLHESLSWMGKTRQHLLLQFMEADNSLEGLTQFLVGGDLELPPLSPDVERAVETHSPQIGMTFPDYLLPIEGSNSDKIDEDDDMGDPDWDAKYADFAYDSDGANFDWEIDEPNVFDEVGPLEDVLLDKCSFESRYADGHWDSLETTLEGDRESFLGPPLGPTRRSSRREVPLHEFFEVFWLEKDLITICRETNKYAMQESVERLGTLNGHGRWETLTVSELRVWFGVCILMGLKQQPTIRSYWSKRRFYGCPIIKHVIRRPRFEQILSCLHLVDNETLVQDKIADAYDKIGKCRWLIESFVCRAKAAYNCNKHLACDEIMVPYRGRRWDVTTMRAESGER